MTYIQFLLVNLVFNLHVEFIFILAKMKMLFFMLLFFIVLNKNDNDHSYLLVFKFSSRYLQAKVPFISLTSKISMQNGIVPQIQVFLTSLLSIKTHKKYLRIYYQPQMGIFFILMHNHKFLYFYYYLDRQKVS